VVLDPGRCLLISVFANYHPVHILNVHVTPSYEMQLKKDLLTLIRGTLAPLEGTIFMGGGWNFFVAEESRFDPNTATSTATTDVGLARYFDDIFPTFAELHQGDYTRRQLRNGHISTLSRIDRIYTDLSAPILLARTPASCAR
jgi:hypothetical protein